MGITKKSNAIYGVIFTIIGIIGGATGTAFSIGADKQRINDQLNNNTRAVSLVEGKLQDYKTKIEKETKEQRQNLQDELDRLVKVMSSQVSSIQNSLVDINGNVSNLRTDVKVIQAIVERLEKQLKSSRTSN